MKSLLIQGGRIIDPAQKIDEVGNLLITGGKISWWGSELPAQEDYAALPAQGLIVCPGLIDLHCHLRQPGFEAKETIATGTRAAARGGFATVCCMPNTEPPLDSREGIENVKSIAREEGCVRVLPIGCVSRGRKGEELADLDTLATAGAVAFSDDGEPVSSPALMLQALRYSRASGLPVINHCEEKDLTAGGQMNAGVLATRLGLRGMPAAAEEIMIARDLALAHLTGGHLHIAHVSSAGSVELIRMGKEAGINVTAEVTPHHLTLTQERITGDDTSFKVNPPLRARRDIDALIQGLNDGAIDAIATDHAPHTGSDKQVDFTRAAFGISGLETALGSLMGLVHDGQLPLVTLIAKLTSEPARVLGDAAPGTLAVGTPADITIFDPDQEWQVEPGAFASRGKNTPLAGTTLRGMVMATLYQGELVYQHQSIKIDIKL